MKHLFKHKITVYNTITRNEYNEMAFSSPVVYCGRFHLKSKIINSIVGANNLGETVVADAMIYLDKELPSITIGTKVVYNNIAYRVLTVLESLDVNSKRHHWEVMVQKWEA